MDSGGPQSANVSGGIEKKCMALKRRKAVCSESFDPTTHQIRSIPKTSQEKGIILNHIMDIFLFQNLDAEQLDGVLDTLYERQVMPGEVIMNYGEEGHTFYIVAQGTLKVYKKRDGVQVLERCYVDRGHFGELYLLYGDTVDERIEATTEGKLWCLDRSDYNNILLSIRNNKLVLLDTYLKNIPLISNITVEEKEKLINIADTKDLEEGEHIVEQGERQKALYILLKGTLGFSQILNNGSTTQWTEDTSGYYFGEKSLSTKCWWPYSVVAQTKVEIACLSVEAVQSLVHLNGH